MSGACRHQDGEFIEWIQASHTREVSGGVLAPEGLNEPGDAIGFEYRCNSCGRSWRWVRAPRQRWLREIHWQLLDGTR